MKKVNVNVSEQLSGLLSKINEKNFYYIFGIGLLIVFLLDYLILMKPQINALAKINPEIKILKDDFKKAKDDIAKIDQYRSQVKSMNENLQKAQTRVRARSEVPLILEKISKAATKNEVIIDQIMPNSDELEMILENKERKYYTLPIELDIRGGYHNFGRFLNALERSDVFLDPQTFMMSAGQATRLHKIKLTLSAIVYDESI